MQANPKLGFDVVEFFEPVPELAGSREEFRFLPHRLSITAVRLTEAFLIATKFRVKNLYLIERQAFRDF